MVPRFDLRPFIRDGGFLFDRKFFRNVPVKQKTLREDCTAALRSSGIIEMKEEGKRAMKKIKADNLTFTILSAVFDRMNSSNVKYLLNFMFLSFYIINLISHARKSVGSVVVPFL